MFYLVCQTATSDKFCSICLAGARSRMSPYVSLFVTAPSGLLSAVNAVFMRCYPPYVPCFLRRPTVHARTCGEGRRGDRPSRHEYWAAAKFLPSALSPGGTPVHLGRELTETRVCFPLTERQGRRQPPVAAQTLQPARLLQSLPHHAHGTRQKGTLLRL